MECANLISNDDIDQNILNDDILEEILVRLPLKSLSRFKCVSKSWHRVISENSLQKRLPLISTGVFFRSESGQSLQPKYAYATQNGIIEYSDLDLFPYVEIATIVDGCNGLLLYYISATRSFFVVNTATKRWVELPCPSKRTQLSVLTFDPYNSPHYKIVCFVEWRARGAGLEIYSSETGKWELREIQFGVETDAMSATMHYFNGILYVIAYPNMLAAINLTTLSCNMIQLPESTNQDGRLGHNQGHLHFVHIDGNKMKVWMIKNSKSSNEWILKHEISVMKFMESKRKSNEVDVLALHPEKDLVYLWIPRKMVCYNLREKKVEGIWKFGKERCKNFFVQVWLFPCTSYLTKCLA